jgi:hypothetical protein
MVTDNDNNENDQTSIEGDYEVTGLTFKRVVPGKKVIVGSADKFDYRLEPREIEGQTIMVKVYPNPAVLYNNSTELSFDADIRDRDEEE